MKIQGKEQQNMEKGPNFRENFTNLIKFENLANKYIRLGEKA